MNNDTITLTRDEVELIKNTLDNCEMWKEGTDSHAVTLRYRDICLKLLNNKLENNHE